MIYVSFQLLFYAVNHKGHGNLASYCKTLRIKNLLFHLVLFLSCMSLNISNIERQKKVISTTQILFLCSISLISDMNNVDANETYSLQLTCTLLFCPLTLLRRKDIIIWKHIHIGYFRTQIRYFSESKNVNFLFHLLSMGKRLTKNSLHV